MGLIREEGDESDELEVAEDDSCSECEDEIIVNDDDVPDEFDVTESFECDAEFAEIDAGRLLDVRQERNFLLGRDGETIWAVRPLNHLNYRTPSKNIVIRFPGLIDRVVGLTKEDDLLS